MKIAALFEVISSKFKVQSFFFFLLLTFYFLLFTSSTFAQTANPFLTPNTNPDVPKNQHIWTQTIMIDVMSAMSCQLTGIDPVNPKSQCLGVDPETGKIGFVPSTSSGQVNGGGGAIGVAGKMITMLYTPPLQTTDYFKYLASNFGIAKPAHAATGFEGLQPIQSLWIAFRDIVYLLFVIIFIVIGLAIMLRIRIDPRTVMTIQNQLPKIIIGLLLLTFSFAIAGFLIDLMYVVIFLSFEIISGAAPAPSNLEGLDPLDLQNATPFTATDGIRGGGVFGIAKDAAGAVFHLANALFSDITEELISGSKSGIPLIGGLFNFLDGLLAKALGFIFGGILGAIASVIAFLVIAIALFIALIRLWFTLIMTYISILLNVVFAPFWIAASLLPGSPIGFGAWLRSMIANLAAFPAVIVMFLLARVFIDSFGSNPSNTDFVPPLIGDISGTDTIGTVIGLGIILMTPNVVTMIKAALKAPGIPAGGIVAGLAAGSRVVSGVPRGIAGTVASSQEYIAGAEGFEKRKLGRALFGRFTGRQ